MGKKKAKPATKLGFLSSVAQRRPKTDRLILERLLAEKARFAQSLRDEAVSNAHAVLVRWADAETSGRLARLKETQLQGDFLGQVFGDALGYARAIDNAARWELEQHQSQGAQTPDATLGEFAPHAEPRPAAVVELKGPKIDLDRDRSQGRTAVDQGWDYLGNMPAECRWLVVSNFVSFRLYERGSTKRCYEHFTLQELRDPVRFKEFYVLLSRRGLP